MLMEGKLPMLENRVLTKTIKFCILATSIMCGSLFAAPILTALPPLTVDVTGVPSYDVYGDPGNTVLSFNVGANTTVTTLTYDIQLSAYFDSWLSEIELRVGDSLQTTGIIFTPGLGDKVSETRSYSGIIDLAALDLAFNVGRDGILRLEFYESFKDLTTGYPDGQWDAGTLKFGLAHLVPEPDSYLLVGIALLALALNLRRRRALGAIV